MMPHALAGQAGAGAVRLRFGAVAQRIFSALLYQPSYLAVVRSTESSPPPHRKTTRAAAHPAPTIAMRIRHLLAASGAAALAACASSSGGAPSNEPATAQAPVPAAEAPASTGAAHSGGSMWQGDIRPESGTSVSGTAMLMAGAGGQTAATITLTGAPASGTHPWHVHSGTCAEKGPIVGPPAAYTPIAVDANGAAKLEATLPFATPTSGSYSVNVHMSPTQMGMIVGCADLRM
jgi:hypothetical protein